MEQEFIDFLEFLNQKEWEKEQKEIENNPEIAEAIREARKAIKEGRPDDIPKLMEGMTEEDIKTLNSIISIEKRKQTEKKKVRMFGIKKKLKEAIKKGEPDKIPELLKDLDPKDAIKIIEETSEEIGTEIK